MLVATSVTTDTRVLREATTLREAGHEVHVIGRSVPAGYAPPAGITVSSVGTSSAFRAEGGASLSGQRLGSHVRFARWLLLPEHRDPTARIDLLSALLLVASLLAIIYGIKRFATQQPAGPSIALLAVGALVGLWFVIRQLRAEQPLLVQRVVSS